MLRTIWCEQAYNVLAITLKEVISMSCRQKPCPQNPRPQTHVHEVQGSVQIAEIPDDPHNHRFATVSSEVRFNPDGTHFHIVKFRTDFYENHYHEFCGPTCNDICVGDNRHIHFLKDETECSDGHRHEIRFATFINDPIGD